MVGRSAKGMNKEKFVCCCTLALLVACALVIALAETCPESSLRSVYCRLFGSVPPERLAEQAPVTVVAPPSGYCANGTLQVPDPRDMTGPRPFAPPREQVRNVRAISNGWWREQQRLAEWVRSSGILKSTTTLVDTQQRISVLDGSSPVAYVGVVGASGQRLGMLRVKDGRFRNVREGERLTDLGCTIIRIEKEAIHLMTRTGVYHILRKAGS
jgi:hypothetical protein